MFLKVGGSSWRREIDPKRPQKKRNDAFAEIEQEEASRRHKKKPKRDPPEKSQSVADVFRFGDPKKPLRDPQEQPEKPKREPQDALKNISGSKTLFFDFPERVSMFSRAGGSSWRRKIDSRRFQEKRNDDFGEDRTRRGEQKSKRRPQEQPKEAQEGPKTLSRRYSDQKR